MSGRGRRILVLGGDGRSTLAIVRSLGRAGWAVDLAWCLPGDQPAVSRWVSRRLDLPQPAADPQWLEPLRRVLTETRYEAVLPSSDAELIPLLLERASLEGLTRLLAPSDAAFRLTFDKQRSTELAQGLGLPVPAWRVLGEEATGLPAEIEPPCVLKPLSSYELGRPTEAKRHVRHAFTREAADALVREMTPEGPVIAQAYFVGRGVGVEMLARQGRVLAAFQHERLHEPPEGGGSSYRRAVALDPALRDAATRLVEAIGYDGVLMVEFKQRPDGAWIFVEINARFWGSLPLTVAAGADFPAWLAEMAVDGREDFPTGYRTGLRARNLLKDLKWFVANWRGDHSNERLIWVPRLTSLGDLGRLVLGLDRLDSYAADDPRPMFVELAQAWNQLWTRIRAKGPLPRARLDPAARILFLCRGNICRSAFAEAALARLRPDQRTASAGTYPRGGRSSPADAVTVGEEFGVALSAHRSRFADADLLDWADEIVVFHPAEFAWLKAHFAQAARKARYLGGRVTGDPYGKGAGAFRRAFASITADLGGAPEASGDGVDRPVNAGRGA